MWHLGPALNAQVALRQVARWIAAGDIFGEAGEPRRDLDFQIGRQLERVQLPIVAKGGSNGLRYPVDHDVGQQLVFAEAPLNLALAVTPGTEFLHDPAPSAPRPPRPTERPHFFFAPLPLPTSALPTQ